MTSSIFEQLEIERSKLRQHPAYASSSALQSRYRESVRRYQASSEDSGLDKELKDLQKLNINLQSHQHQRLFEAYQRYKTDHSSEQNRHIYSVLKECLEETPMLHRELIIDYGIKTILQSFSEYLSKNNDKLFHDYVTEMKEHAKTLIDPADKLGFLVQLILDSKWMDNKKVKAVQDSIHRYERAGEPDKANRIKAALFTTPLKEREHLIRPPSGVLNALAADKDGMIHLENSKKPLEIDVTRAGTDFRRFLTKYANNPVWADSTTRYTLYLSEKTKKFLAKNPEVFRDVTSFNIISFEQSMGFPPRPASAEPKTPGVLKIIGNLLRRIFGGTVSPPIAPLGRVAGGGSAGHSDTTTSMISDLSSVTPIPPPAGSPGARDSLHSSTPKPSRAATPGAGVGSGPPGGSPGVDDDKSTEQRPTNRTR